jgi:hypothetical protein
MPRRCSCGVGLDTCSMVEVDPKRFEVMVSEALDGLPEELRELMSNVAVTVPHDAGPAGVLGPSRSSVDPPFDVLRRRPARPDHDLSPSHLCGLRQRAGGRRTGSADCHSRGGSSLRNRRRATARARMVSQQAPSAHSLDQIAPARVHPHGTLPNGGPTTYALVRGTSSRRRNACTLDCPVPRRRT